MALQTTLPGHSPVWTSSQNMLTVCGRVFANMTFCFCHRKRMLFLLCTILSLITKSLGIGEVVWAVNCGGDAHTDINGIRYEADSLKVGISSDYGKTLMVSRVVAQDQILYQTERYHMSTFGYDIPLNGDGEYVLVLKFCEVWFTSPNQKVFDVTLNGEHTVVDELDIYSKVGRGVAHDELIEFTIRSGKLKVNGETSKINSKLLVEFMKGDYDNPKINAIYLMKGTIDDIPKLPSLPGTETSREEEEVDEEEETSDRPSKARRPSGPKVKDPYASDDTSTMLLPVIMALGAFIPLLFCLCKL
ncbi:malectin-A-like [Ylistrum balloti]|uniref:malectin-A-like n=1 Tax=Ylistrum balloti TaxID=509963 RepID=UPI002905CB94|nr:malectin-A-like [Ylistrum balloti]